VLAFEVQGDGALNKAGNPMMKDFIFGERNRQSGKAVAGN
jgi:hypothetical protein